MSAAEVQARVRMYNVGFGDCFLLSWPGPEPHRDLKVLIDCGSHSHGPGPRPIGEVVAQVIEDLRDEPGGRPRADVVVATHRHQDHVSGFASELWNEVEVAEVWMPWTEHPTDPEARSIRETQSRTARRLQVAAAALGAGDALRDSILALSANSLTNAKAMETLHHGFRKQPKRQFLPSPLTSERSFKPACLPGVHVHVLGPSRDSSVIRDMDPPAGKSYLQMADEQEARKGEPWLPFAPAWKLGTEQMLGDPEIAHLVPRRKTDLRTIANLNKMDSKGHLDLAVQLEKAVNGTSLVLVFEIGRSCLLFPGDAQWGTWRVALEDLEWRNLLARTCFCKVGHHGSHNATPRDLLEETLGEGFAAMISTRPISNWPDIPRGPLLDALEEKTGNRVVRSDQPSQATPAGFQWENDLYVDLSIPL